MSDWFGSRNAWMAAAIFGLVVQFAGYAFTSWIDADVGRVCSPFVSVGRFPGHAVCRDADGGFQIREVKP